MTTSPVMTITDELLAELEEAASKATPQHLDSAGDVIRADSGAMIECPVCGGEGYASLENEYCNFDNHAIGVQFYGIGPEFGAAEEYYRRANPSTITALTAELHRLRAENAELARVVKDVRWRVADTTDQLQAYGHNGDRLYGLDEWSAPIRNLNIAIGMLEKATQ